MPSPLTTLLKALASCMTGPLSPATVLQFLQAADVARRTESKRDDEDNEALPEGPGVSSGEAVATEDRGPHPAVEGASA